MNRLNQSDFMIDESFSKQLFVTFSSNGFVVDIHVKLNQLILWTFLRQVLHDSRLRLDSTSDIRMIATDVKIFCIFRSARMSPPNSNMNMLISILMMFRSNCVLLALISGVAPDATLQDVSDDTCLKRALSIRKEC